MRKRRGVLLAGLRAALIPTAVVTLPAQAQAQAQEQGPAVEVTNALDLAIVEDFTRGRSALRFHIPDAASDTAFDLRFDRIASIVFTGTRSVDGLYRESSLRRLFRDLEISS